jgi:hypothetical protein
MKQFRAMNKLKKVALKVIKCSEFRIISSLLLSVPIQSLWYILHCFCWNQVVAENLSEEEIVGLKEMFKSLDTDNSGTITLEELRTGLPKLGTKITESELRQLMEAVSSYIIALGVSQAYYLFLYMLQCSYLNTVIVP